MLQLIRRIGQISGYQESCDAFPGIAVPLSTRSLEHRHQLVPVREPKAVTGIEIEVFKQKRCQIARVYDATISVLDGTAATRVRADHKIDFLVQENHFKAINDGFGHETGDAFLKSLAARLTV
ncbi:diguanylate cyclase domain-containing protein [Streptomyces natalensis]|uniref:GGDEF domain-containing protein n=1 Tax=Streptomyces natalensis ATCC 27448 TaxID=1240678 RepID=A0A0D7CHN7_9ACTN|nr:diguanylate cyclase [Streptomyces natalensis]KIZ15693.1 hypothetical protein SNA_25510 [Streptomyces natalensis ATCC 27448]